MTLKSILVVLILGAIAGVVFSGSLASFIQYSSTMDFCISCHEMESTVYQEYKETSHYANESGVRAKCVDCHLVHGNWIATLATKIVKSKELYYHALGKLDTPEKFEAHRLEMAESVWASMKASDSRECRNCHVRDAMLIDEQKKRAQVKHREAMEKGMTCIDCHKGIAHKPVHEQEKENEAEGGEESFSL